MTATTILLNGTQNHGSDCNPLHCMKSGSFPPVASNFKYIAIP